MSTETRARATMAGFAMLAALFALLLVGAGGCGGGSGTTETPPITGDDVDAGPPTVTTGPYQPLTVGSTWTYHVEDQGVVYDKQSSVEAFEDMGGDRPPARWASRCARRSRRPSSHLVRADGDRRPPPP